MGSMVADRLADHAARIPLLRGLLSRAYRHAFNRARGRVRLFYGLYPDFASAIREVPPYWIQGYDNEQTADRNAHERLQICAFDYPIMFWLQRLLPECRLLFDFGGNVGISYFGYRKYLQYPASLTWLIYEVPAVAALGARIAAEEGAHQLRFTTELDELQRADILLAAGSLHFVDKPFELLRSVATPPRHVLLNKVPLRDRPAAVTLHNMGTALCPYHLFNRSEFLGSFRSLGYELVDEWETPDLGARIPLHPEDSIRAYTGFYLRKA